MGEVAARLDLGPKYEVLRLLDRGGMGEIWEIRHRELGKVLAAKVLPAGRAAGPMASDVAFERMRREALAASRIGHEGIVLVHDFDRAPDGSPFLVMEKLEGEDLSRRIARAAPLPPAEAVRLCTAVAGTLAAAHAVGLVHRDVKPANVFLVPAARAGEPEQVKLLDFGLTKFLDPASGPAATLTTEGQELGTLFYMAPEQALGAEIDGRADVFGVGMILHELLTGRSPWAERTPQAVATQLVTDAPVPIDGARLAAVPALREVIRRAVAKRREDRFADMPALIAALAAGLAGRAPAASPRQRRRRWLAAGAGVAALGIVGAVVAVRVGREAGAGGGSSSGPTSPAVAPAVAPAADPHAAELAAVGTTDLQALEHFRAGVQTFQRYQYPEAAAHFARAVARDPKFAYARYFELLCRSREGVDPDETEVNDVIARLPGTEREFFRLSHVLDLAMNDANQQQLLDWTLRAGLPHHRVLVLYYTKPEAALAERLLAFDTPFVPPLDFAPMRLAKLTTLALDSGDRARMLSASQAYLAAFPEEEIALGAAAGAAITAGEYADARRHLDRYLATSPDMAAGRGLEARLCVAIGDWPCAVADEERARFNKKTADWRRYAGLMCGHAWRYGLAAEADRYCAIPDGAAPWQLFWQIDRGKPLEDVESPAKMTVFARKDAWYRQLADGYALLHAKRYEQALAQLPTDLLIPPDTRSIEGTLMAPELRGVALAGLRRWDEALAEFDRVLAVNPRCAFVLVRVGDTLAAAGRAAEAAAAYAKALAVWQEASDDLPLVAATRRKAK